MQLNSILFPAPKSSYTVDSLKGELLWIPKYKKVPCIVQRQTTFPSDNHITFFNSGTSTPTETMKNAVPQPRKKKSMPKNYQIRLDTDVDMQCNSVEQEAQFDTRQVKTEIDEMQYPLNIRDHQQYKQPSMTDPSNESDSPNVSVLEISRREEEPMNLKMSMKANNLKVKNSQTLLKKDLSTQFDHAEKQSPIHNNSKKSGGSFSSSTKDSKKDTGSTRENSLNGNNKKTSPDSPQGHEELPHKDDSDQGDLTMDEAEHPPIAHEKKSILRIAQSAEFGGFHSLRTPRAQPKAKIDLTSPIKNTHLLKQNNASKSNISQDHSRLSKEESKINFDQDFYEEYPTTANVLSSPKNLQKYKTRLLPNPSIIKKSKNSSISYGGFQSARYETQNLIDQLEKKNYSGINKTGMGHQQKQQHTKPTTNKLAHSNFGHFNTTNHTHNHQTHTIYKDVLDRHIPCLLLKSHIPTQKIMIYFHGNGEDIYLAYDLLTHIRNNLNINVLAVEYPGYGLYQGASSDSQILADAEAVFDYLTFKMKHNAKNIIIFGRSIGSGPAAWLAARKSVGALVLMSAFTSIRAVVRDLAGKWASYVIKERFNNMESMQRVNCPSFLIHGLKDSLIPYKQSQELHNACKGPCELILPKEMDHIEFDFYEDFTAPLAFFLTRCNFELRPKKGERIEFEKSLFETPDTIKRILKIHK